MLPPKKYITTNRLRGKAYGKEARLNYGKEIMRDEPYFPKPLEYEDIDKAVFDFFDQKIDIEYNGEKIPTYSLYSNQRFSEYTQTWKHTDENNNLLLNFKTVSREINPNVGKNQGGYWNIPNDRYYTLRIRNVLDDNGTESYEIYSMKQPFCVDLMYRVNIVTDKFSILNAFNQKINSYFASRQCYIRPNGHFIPMVIDNINDESSYSIEDRKFFVQSFNIKVMAYIIAKDDFKVEKRPKRFKLYGNDDMFGKNPSISIDEYEDKMENRSVELSIDFKEYNDKVKFTFDTNAVFTDMENVNVRNVRMSVNGTPYFIDKGFTLKEGDEVMIRIRHIDDNLPSSVKFMGYDPYNAYLRDDTPESVKDEPVKSETISVE